MGDTISPIKVKKAPSPCSDMLLESEAWTENNTYYIRYTFTNPTSKPIEEKLDYINISYNVVPPQQKFVPRRGQYSDTIRTLSIPPHSSRSFVVPLTINEPFEIIYFVDSTFYFADNALLHHELSYGQESSDVLMTPIFLPNGEVYIAMKNHHPTKTISDIRNIHLDASFESEGRFSTNEYYYADHTPLAIQLQPQETAFFRLPKTCIEPNNAFSFAALNICIDGIRHEFAVTNFESRVFKPYTATRYTDYDTKYLTSDMRSVIKLIEADGTYEIDGNTLNGYLRIKNSSDHQISIPDLHMSSDLHYYKPDNLLKVSAYRILFLKELSLDPKEEAFLSFSIPLPSQDMIKEPRLKNISLSMGLKTICSKVNFIRQKLEPIQKARYIPAQRTILEEANPHPYY